MKPSLFIGVDGGATKCMVRVEDDCGRLLGREISGPANIRISVPKAWEAIHTALDKILNQLGIKLYDTDYHWHAGMGLAGCEFISAYQGFLSQPNLFETLVLSSDAHTACLGAHAGRDGAIIIIGTGVVGFQVQSNQTSKVGGWGFPYDDQGGGAFLGFRAMQVTLQSIDGRISQSRLADTVYEKFDSSLDQLLAFANTANSTAFAELAPMVIQQAEAGDIHALNIMKEAAHAVDQIYHAMRASQIDSHQLLPCSLIGGVAPFLETYLSEELRSNLSPSELTPDAGAVLLVRDYLGREE